MNQLEVSNAELLAMFHNHGYKVVVELRGDSKFATLVGTYWYEPVPAGQYSTEWSDYEIREDCIPKLFQCSGLRLVSALEY